MIRYDDGDIQFHAFKPDKWRMLSNNKRRVMETASENF